MFNKSRIESEASLLKLLEDVKSNLHNKRVLFSYPEILTNSDGLNKWATSYREIDILNNKILVSIQNKAGVYAIYVQEPNKIIELKYVGQTNAKGAKQRIRSHLVWRNKETKSGKYTGSKFDDVVNNVILGKSIYLSFCEISPESLRHYIEEKLFSSVENGWNIHG